MAGANYDAALARSGLPQAAALRALLRPGLALRTEIATTYEIGGSRLGGQPDLPPRFSWPSWQGKPQAFLAQIDLAELPSFPDRDLLPTSGRLYFFYDADRECWGHDQAHRGSAAVIYDSTPTNRLSPCWTATSEGLRMPPPSLAVTSFDPIQTAPGIDALALEWVGLSGREVGCYVGAIEAADLAAGLIRKEGSRVAPSTPDPGDDDEISWEELSWAHGYEEDGADPAEVVVENGPFHQLLGHPRGAQGAMEWTCALTHSRVYCVDADDYGNARPDALKAEADDWRLLLQLDSDERLGWSWGDFGRVYYWIRRESLANRQFDGAWLVLQ